MKIFKLVSPVHLAALQLTTALFSAAAATPTGLDSAGQLQAIPTTASKLDAGLNYTELQNGIQLRVNRLVKNVLFYTPDIVRVNATLGHTYTQQPSLTVIIQPGRVKFKIKKLSDGLQLSTEKLGVHVDGRTGALRFEHLDGGVIVTERADTPQELNETTISGAPTYEANQTFTLADNESIYGLGQYQDGQMDYRGQKVILSQFNQGIAIPLMLSTRRYGVMLDIYSKMLFHDDARGASFWCESAPAGIDYYFIAGDTMDGVIRGYRHLTGNAPMLTKSAFGLWMSKERYTSAQNLINVVRQFRENGIPLDNIVQDWQYWGGNDQWSGMVWDQTHYPDPPGMVRSLHDELHVKLMCSIWPSSGNNTALARELDAKGLRYAPLHVLSGGRIYDAYSSEARDIYFKYIRHGLLDIGVDALWMDGTEPEVAICDNPQGSEAGIKSLGTNALGDFTRYLSPYSLVTTKGVYEHQRALENDKRVMTLTRSAFLGQQHYAAVPWSGDIVGTYDVLHKQISAGLNLCMAGLPYWTQDTGGFNVRWTDGEKNPEYRELFDRWYQFSTFNPLLRVHGTDINRELYLFKDLDPEVFDSLMTMTRLRYQLLPYIYSMSWMITDRGYTMMRGLPLDFPDDLQARKLDDEFMFGPAFLVHPVTCPIYRKPASALAAVPPSAFQTPDGQPGAVVEYFKGDNFQKFVSKTVEESVDHTWPHDAYPPQGLDSFDNFSARWNAVLTMPEDGEYEIGAEADDGVRVWLDGKLIVDDWGIHAARYKGGTLTFYKGQKVRLKIDYFQGGGDRVMRFVWKTPSQLGRNPAQEGSTDNTVETYLPAGTDWYDFWTNERLSGGRKVAKACPLNVLPIYIRAGSIVPMGPVMNYTTEKPDAHYTIHVYPSSDASFTIYEDDNETYNYEKGEFTIIPVRWDEKRQVLTIGERQGSFPGMVKERKMSIVWILPPTPGGKSPMGKTDAEIMYRGKALTIPLPHR